MGRAIARRHRRAATLPAARGQGSVTAEQGWAWRRDVVHRQTSDQPAAGVRSTATYTAPATTSATRRTDRTIHSALRRRRRRSGDTAGAGSAGVTGSGAGPATDTDRGGWTRRSAVGSAGACVRVGGAWAPAGRPAPGAAPVG